MAQAFKDDLTASYTDSRYNGHQQMGRSFKVTVDEVEQTIHANVSITFRVSGSNGRDFSDATNKMLLKALFESLINDPNVTAMEIA